MWRHAIVHRALGFAWLTFVAVWVIMAFTAKRTVKQQSSGSRLLHLALGVIAYMLIFSDELAWGLLSWRFIAWGPAVAAAGVALTYAGLAISIWARAILGRNWSASVTVKQDHRLIRQGPYAVVRHPIYSGLLLATLGTALVVGQVRALAGLAITFVLWLMKSRLEERFMLEEFGGEYEEYRRHSWALVPFVL
ncbi:MAG TPA: methyltransferase [Terriglobia bacterium]|nr:methyltransferase [Terriglobia bacterium]